MATDVPIDRATGAGERTDHIGRTTALVDLGNNSVAAHRGSNGTGAVLDLALRKIEQAVRGEDRVCPFGTTRVAITFGPDADAVSPRTLGERLARAIRQSALMDAEADHQRRQALAQEGGTSQPVASAFPSSATIAVDRMIDGAARLDHRITKAAEAVGSRIPNVPTRQSRWLRHRTIVRCSAGGFARYGTRHDDIVPGDRGTILVVCPCRTSGAPPGLSAVAASAMAERMGYEVGTVALSCDDELVLDVRGSAVELVVLVVEGDRESTTDRTTWASSTWHIPAQLVAKYCSRGIGVLAVGAGGGVGALASCVAQGAAVVLDLDELQAELGHADDASAADESWTALSGNCRVPRAMEALILLTASERRVLFYLTTGRSAQEIADDLVVSVTTVRSHIRSILRKLGVRSQLAAVAIANSQDFSRNQPSASAPPIQRELETPGVT
jgi:DNA-binding CsgD family transcriptional regulator